MRDRPIRRRTWILGSAALLSSHALLSLALGPLPYDEAAIQPQHLIHILLTVAVVILFPGLPFSRLYYLKRQGSLARVLGLGFVLNTCFFLALTRALVLLGIPPTAWSVLPPTVLVSAAGLCLLCRGEVRARPWITRLDRFNLFVGCCAVLGFIILQGPNIARPSSRYFDDAPWTRTFLQSRPAPGASHAFGSGFHKLHDNNGWALRGERGAILVTCAAPPCTFPLRLALLSPFGARISMQAGDEVLGSRVITNLLFKDAPSSQQRGAAPPRAHALLPRHQSLLLALDIQLNSRSTTLWLRSDRGPVMVDDYSNLESGRARRRFQREYALNGDRRILAEGLYHMQDSITREHLYSLEADMPVGYITPGITALLSGRGTLALNLLSMALGLLCLLISADLVQGRVSRHRRLCVVLPVLVTLGTLTKLLTTGMYHLYLPDLAFTVYLMVSMGSLVDGRLGGYWAASIPTALTRLSGLPLLLFHHLALLLLGPERRRSLRALGLTALFWALFFPLLLLHILARPGWLPFVISRVRHAVITDHRAAATSLGARNLLDYLASLVRASAGTLVFLIPPLHRLSQRLLIIIILYSALLMKHWLLHFYHFVPLVYFCCIAATANIISRKRAWRFLLPLAVALAAWHIFLPVITYNTGSAPLGGP